MNLLIILAAKYLFLIIIALVGIYAVSLPAPVKKQFARLSLISLPFSFLLLKAAAAVYFNPRPFIVSHLQPLFPHIADNGFPSDHTTLCVTLSSLVFVFNKKVGLVLYFLSLLVGISRVLALVHHPLDILAGFVIGTVSVFSVRIISKKISFT